MLNFIAIFLVIGLGIAGAVMIVLALMAGDGIKRTMDRGSCEADQ